MGKQRSGILEKCPGRTSSEAILTGLHKLLGWRLLVDSEGIFSLTVNSRGHFLVVITNGWSANATGCRGKAPARFSEHCSVLGLGLG